MKSPVTDSKVILTVVREMGYQRLIYTNLELFITSEMKSEPAT